MDLHSAAEGPDGGEPEFSAAFEIRLAVLVGGHTRDLDELLEQLLEMRSLVRDKLRELGASESHEHSSSAPKSLHGSADLARADRR